ncbi:hypothetical protein MKW98_020941 [Papaver atlanticum]|uniref:F-box domain-containing protein n=1 Tax=Papaver atlanticum TaxID=357466 RepID=A0AAD4XUL5_9MAGN|nr:hypothetical protein MKW98_020941 [Papaver atlanticum]
MEIIPGLPNEIGRECLIRVPYDRFATLISVSRTWKQEVKSAEFFQRRKTSGLNQSMIAILQTDPTNFITTTNNPHITTPKYRLCLYEPGKNERITLPAIPGCDDGVPLFCQCAGVGRNLVVIGGWDTKSWQVLNSVYIYNLVTGTWRRGADLPGDTRSFFACASDSKTVYIAGGHDQEKNALKSALAYDVSGNVWAPLPDMARHRDECKGLFYGGKFHVIGGYQTEMQGDFEKSAETFDVETGTWNPVEEDVLGTDAYPKTCLFDNKGNLYKCCASYLGRLYGSTWQRFAEFPVDVCTGTFIATWGETIVVIGSKIYGGSLNCYALVFGEHKEKCGWTKLEMPKEFIGSVQFGCNLQL